ncbi:MAG TPA: hypothetical protein VEC17_00975, partial [Candidatus Binatia bacterium]|nr:hypothetical protein [Candidatus Binatia bacterium]
GKLGVEPVFLYYPSLDTSYDSHQFTMGADFINHFPEEDMTTRGYLMEGKITYDLVPRLAVTFGYSFQRLMSSDVNVLGPTNEYLASRSATFGLRTGF